MTNHQILVTHHDADAFELIRTIVGKDVLRDYFRDDESPHPLIRFGHPPDYPIHEVEMLLQSKLEEMKWQFVTCPTKYILERTAEALVGFAIAPLLLVKHSIGYHVTLKGRLSEIFKVGLLPSCPKIKISTYPDTMGKIHVCPILGDIASERETAFGWKLLLAKDAGIDESEWCILKIDLANLSKGRTYRDAHSSSGVVIDRIDAIPPERLTVV